MKRANASLAALAATLITMHATAAESQFGVYSEVDLFAFSEVISIAEFADDFAGDLQPGESAFSQNRIELGVKWNNWTFAYVDRFDYLTEFTPDTAIIHHANKNNLPLANRVYNASLDVARVRAKGQKAGYEWTLSDTLSLRGAAT